MGRGTTRRVVEGLIAAGVQYVIEHALGIFPQLACLDSDSANAAMKQPSIAPRVSRWIAPHVMRQAVDLHDQLGSGAVEVEHEGTGRMLVTEPETGRAFAEQLPEANLRRRHGAAKSAGSRDGASCRLPHGPSTALRAVPLPIRCADRED